MLKKRKKNTEKLDECMAKALLSLMEDKPFSEIHICELAKKSGASRNYFYKHFRTKESVAEHSIRLLFKGYAYKKTMPYRARIEHFMLYLLDHKKDLLLLHRDGLSYLLLNPIKEHYLLRMAEKNLSPEEKYRLMLHADAFYELICLWFD